MHIFTNTIYARWSVKSFSHRKGSHYFYNCLCSCGVFKKVDISSLKNGKSKSCGCLTKEKSKERGKKNFKDMSGKKFGKLLVLKRSKNNISKIVRYICKCDCGVIKEIMSSSLKSGSTKSCGCLAKEIHIKHNMSNKPIYKVYYSMKSRCYNNKNKRFKYYGGCGITICDEWLNSFETFYKDMGPRPSKKHSIDRIDNNKGYSKENCRWATRSQQDNNKSDNNYIEYKNKKLTIGQWSKILNINYQTLSKRKKLNWSAEKILTTPIKQVKHICYNGYNMKLDQWAYFLGSKDPGAIRTRLKRGWSIERALTQPFKNY